MRWLVKVHCVELKPSMSIGKALLVFRFRRRFLSILLFLISLRSRALRFLGDFFVIYNVFRNFAEAEQFRIVLLY